MTRKTENSGQTAKRRKTGGRDFKKGQPSPNPAGRPKKDFDLVTRCRELTPPIIERYAKMGARAKTGPEVLAGKVVIEYGHDKPRQRVEMTGKDGKDLMPAARVDVMAALRAAVPPAPGKTGEPEEK